MRTILFLLLCLAPGAVMAQSEVCNSSWTVNVVTVASHTATQVDASAIKMTDRKMFEVQNISTDTVHCTHASGVTAGNGRLLTASGGSWSMNIKDVGSLVVISTATPYYLNTNTTFSLYCIGSGTNITSKVVLTQCK